MYQDLHGNFYTIDFETFKQAYETYQDMLQSIDFSIHHEDTYVATVHGIENYYGNDVGLNGELSVMVKAENAEEAYKIAVAEAKEFYDEQNG